MTPKEVAEELLLEYTNKSENIKSKQISTLIGSMIKIAAYKDLIDFDPTIEELKVLIRFNTVKAKKMSEKQRVHGFLITRNLQNEILEKCLEY